MNLVDGIQLRSSAQNHMKNGNTKVHLSQLVAVLNEDALLIKKFILWQEFTWGCKHTKETGEPRWRQEELFLIKH